MNRQYRETNWRSVVLCTVLACATIAGGCSSRLVGIDRVKAENAYRHRTSSALSSRVPSNETLIVLRRYELTRQFDVYPEATIAWLHDRMLKEDVGANELFALVELSFLYAKRLFEEYPASGQLKDPVSRSRDRESAPVFETGPRVEARKYALAAAVYALAFLFPEDQADGISLIDPRARVACDVFNLAVAAAFSADEGYVHPRGGTYAVPFGTVDVTFDDAELVWGRRKLVDFIPVETYEVHGLRNRYRFAGIGAPLVARTISPDPDSPAKDFVAKKAWVPATLLLQLDKPREQLRGARLHATLELYAGTGQNTVNMGGHEMPLELDPTVALAATLEESRLWDSELANFLGKALAIDKRSRLTAQEPYQAGRIPVVFIHGTNSSGARWADMVNDLSSDPRIRDRYYFMLFSYDSGNPILYSSMLLERSLKEFEKSQDSQGGDPCLRNMVLIGHSQGGLLAKVAVIESGDRFWDAIYDKPFDKVKLSRDTRALVREAMFVKPLPFVRRVVFIATPHRGSFLAGPQLVRRIAARFIQLPADVLRFGIDAARFRTSAGQGVSERIPTSIDNMSPGHPFIRTISEIPIDPKVRAHSIVALRAGESEEDGSDGVVKYTSAHIDGVESELIVRSGHSVQSNPYAVEEVRRILLLHANSLDCGR